MVAILLIPLLFFRRRTRCEPNGNLVDESSVESSSVKKMRVVTFDVVNPFRRIISTREVAPQQQQQQQNLHSVVGGGGAMSHMDAVQHRENTKDERDELSYFDWNLPHIYSE